MPEVDPRIARRDQLQAKLRPMLDQLRIPALGEQEREELLQRYEQVLDAVIALKRIARALTLAALTQHDDKQGSIEDHVGVNVTKSPAINFLLDSGLNTKPAKIVSLSGADLSEAFLSGAKFWQPVCPEGKGTNSGCLVPPARQ